MRSYVHLGGGVVIRFVGWARGFANIHRSCVHNGAGITVWLGSACDAVEVVESINKWTGGHAGLYIRQNGVSSFELTNGFVANEVGVDNLISRIAGVALFYHLSSEIYPNENATRSSITSCTFLNFAYN